MDHQELPRLCQRDDIVDLESNREDRDDVENAMPIDEPALEAKTMSLETVTMPPMVRTPVLPRSRKTFRRFSRSRA